MICDGCKNKIGPQDTRLLLFEAKYEGHDVSADDPILVFHNFDCSREYYGVGLAGSDTYERPLLEERTDIGDALIGALSSGNIDTSTD
jgi:hypothetical protein